MDMTKRFCATVTALLLTAGMAGVMSGCGTETEASQIGEDTVVLTNVSYDPTRELYAEYNELFENYYKETYGKDVKIVQSHGGSGSQARSVIEGAEADVVTLALENDISLLERAGMLEEGWQDEFPDSSAPYTSTIVFLVRSGNEKNITDWDDLVKKGVEVITPDPKSSGGACWNFLAAWNYAQKQFDGDEEKSKEFVQKLYANVIVMDSGARGATTTFVENGQGDVLIAWENEALTVLEEYPGEYELVTPSSSILAQPTVAIVDENADKDGTQEISREYLNYLYSDEAQNIIAENGYRPSNETILQNYGDKFDLNVELCTIDDFGGWAAAYEKFFLDGGIFDEIYEQ